MRPAISLRWNEITVGSEVRQAHHQHHVIAGWHFKGGEVVSAGTWVCWPWTPGELAAHARQVEAHKRARRVMRVLRPVVKWLADADGSRFVDAYDYDDEGDYRVEARGLKPWLDRHTPLPRRAAALNRAFAKPRPYSVLLTDCYFEAKSDTPTS